MTYFYLYLMIGLLAYVALMSFRSDMRSISTARIVFGAIFTAIFWPLVILGSLLILPNEE